MLRIIIGLFFVSSALAQEALPAPREVEPPIRLAKTLGGYTWTLTRPTAEKLRDLLQKTDADATADFVKGLGKDKADPQVQANIEALAWFIRTQTPTLQKEMQNKVGPNGVTIRVFGLEKPAPKRPLIDSAIKAFAPPEVQAQVEAVKVVIQTPPMHWRVEPR